MHSSTLPMLAAACAILGAPVLLTAQTPTNSPLAKALTFHASFDHGFDADFSKGSKACTIKQGREAVPAAENAEVKLVSEGGKYGKALHFTKKGATRPQYSGQDGVLGYNDQSWSATVSVWLRLTPDEDLEPGYCDPVQIVGDDTKKGFIFLEWSRDERPRFFRYAIRPLVQLWNPENKDWATMEKRPMVQVAKAPFSRDKWTHAVFTLERVNEKDGKPTGKLYLNGELQGSIEGWDLTFGWDPAKVQLVLGAAYVGHLDDLAVFNRPLSAEEVKQLMQLKGGVGDLY
jgi:hypothetical protein